MIGHVEVEKYTAIAILPQSLIAHTILCTTGIWEGRLTGFREFGSAELCALRDPAFELLT